MSKDTKYFEMHGHAGMRPARLPSTSSAAPCCHARRAVTEFARIRGFASVLRLTIGRLCTAMDNLPQLPQLGFKKLGQCKPNKHAMPQLPQPAPTIFNMNREKKEEARRV